MVTGIASPIGRDLGQVRSAPCASPTCKSECALAYRCYRDETATGLRLAWPAVALAVLVALGLFL